MSNELSAVAARLVTQLGGRWQSHGAMCLCPAHNDTVPSLSIRVGRTALLFKCFAGCETSAVLRAIGSFDLTLPAQDRQSATRRHEGSGSSTTDLARNLWGNAQNLAGTPGEAYLRGRYIDTSLMGLRWHPRTPLGRGRDVRFRPALLAAVQEGARLVAVQRHFLDRDGFGLAPDLVPPKRMLGSPGAGVVRLFRAGHRMGLAEGIESAASAAILLGLPVWAVLGAERLHQISIPDFVETLVLLPDNDQAGIRAERLSRRIYGARAISTETIWPWWGLNDWNDVLRAVEGRGGTDVSLAGVSA